MSNVRGPTSALTEFLRERGITARNPNRFRRRDADERPPEQPADPAVAQSPSAATTGSPTAATPSLRRRISRNNSSMNFEEDDETEEEEELPLANGSTNGLSTSEAGPSTPRSTRASNKRSTSSTKAETESKEKELKGKGKAKKRADREDDNDDEENDDPLSSEIGLPQATSSRANFSYANRTPGSIAYCGMCKSKFTITQYTKMGDKGPLCHKCGPLYKPGASDGARKDKPKPKKRQARRKNMFDGSQRTIPTLQSYCIDIISKHIENVEALGDIGFRNMDAISKSISKNRSLNPRTVQLFLFPDITTLSLYDCSKLDSESLQSIATFSPNLEHINLQLCGMLDNAAMDVWSQKLKKLKSVELYGPFLVRKEAWHRFFEAVGTRLESFKIRESPRFDLSCVEAMIKHCPNVRELGLAQIGPLDKTMLKPLEGYGTQLTYLDVSDPGVSAPGIPPKSLEDEEVVSLLKEVGKNLVHLDLSKNVDLTDRVIQEGIEPHCQNLQTLRLIGLEKIETEVMTHMFTSWSSEAIKGIKYLHLDRMLELDDDMMESMLMHSGPDLIELSLNSVDGITEKGLEILSNAKNLPQLESLDLSFVRAVDDDNLTRICSSLPSLKKVFIFGCNRISDFMKSDRVQIIGKEKSAA